MSVDTLEQVPPVEAEPHVWSLRDRCDADKGVKGYRDWEVAEQAYHRWTKGDGELFFCNHHNTQYQEQLFINGWSVESHPHHDKLDQPLDINHIDD